jgi:hypothetical protein
MCNITCVVLDTFLLLDTFALLLTVLPPPPSLPACPAHSTGSSNPSSPLVTRSVRRSTRRCSSWKTPCISARVVLRRAGATPNILGNGSWSKVKVEVDVEEMGRHSTMEVWLQQSVPAHLSHRWAGTRSYIPFITPSSTSSSCLAFTPPVSGHFRSSSRSRSLLSS